MSMILNAVIALLLCFQLNVSAKAIDTFSFYSGVQQDRFHHLLSELRCLVCQNQNLAESNAPLAQDLKAEVYRQILAGFTDQEIRRYLVERYGEYVLFKPRLSTITFVLWLGPFIFLCGALGILFLSIKKQLPNDSVYKHELN